jgi:hypothetical protein
MGGSGGDGFVGHDLKSFSEQSGDVALGVVAQRVDASPFQEARYALLGFPLSRLDDPIEDAAEDGAGRSGRRLLM